MAIREINEWVRRGRFLEWDYDSLSEYFESREKNWFVGIDIYYFVVDALFKRGKFQETVHRKHNPHPKNSPQDPKRFQSHNRSGLNPLKIPGFLIHNPKSKTQIICFPSLNFPRYWSNKSSNNSVHFWNSCFNPSKNSIHFGQGKSDFGGLEERIREDC